MVHAVREDDAVREFGAERRKCSIVSDVARREDKSGLLAMQVCKGFLQRYRMLVMA